MNFLRKEELYRLTALGDEEAAEQSALDGLEELLRNGEFSAVDGFLNGLDPTRISVVTSLLILTISFPAKGQLTEREAFLSRVEPHFEEELGPIRTERLLADRR